MPADKPADAPAPAAVEFEQTLEEFCSAVSATGDLTLELIAGFYSDEVRKAVRKAAPSAFQADLDAFAGRPVTRA